MDDETEDTGPTSKSPFKITVSGIADGKNARQKAVERLSATKAAETSLLSVNKLLNAIDSPALRVAKQLDPSSSWVSTIRAAGQKPNSLLAVTNHLEKMRNDLVKVTRSTSFIGELTRRIEQSMRRDLDSLSNSIITQSFGERAYLNEMGRNLTKQTGIVDEIIRSQRELVGASSAINKILLQVKQNKDVWESLGRTTSTGLMAASLANAGLPDSFGTSFADLANVLSTATLNVSDEALWQEAATDSVLIDGIISFSNFQSASDEGSQDSFDALEKHTGNVQKLVSDAETPAKLLHLLQYLSFILLLAQTLLLVYQELASGADQDEVNIFPAYLESLEENVANPLKRAAEEVMSKADGLNYVVCKVSTREVAREICTARISGVSA